MHLSNKKQIFDWGDYLLITKGKYKNVIGVYDDDSNDTITGELVLVLIPLNHINPLITVAPTSCEFITDRSALDV